MIIVCACGHCEDRSSFGMLPLGGHWTSNISYGISFFNCQWDVIDLRLSPFLEAHALAKSSTRTVRGKSWTKILFWICTACTNAFCRFQCVPHMTPGRTGIRRGLGFFDHWTHVWGYLNSVYVAMWNRFASGTFHESTMWNFLWVWWVGSWWLQQFDDR